MTDEVSNQQEGDHPWASLAPENRQRLGEIMQVQVPAVFRANRVIEQQTGYTSEICSQMFVDVLSHLGTLAAGAGRLTPEQEASQLAKIEEHLRRALIEHPEEIARGRVVDIAKLWSTYHREAVPWRRDGTLHNAPRHAELEELRQRIGVLMEQARATKPDETTWEESLDAAAAMTEAAALCAELLDKLDQCIGAGQLAQDAQRDRKTSGRRWAIGLVVAVLIAIGGGYWAGTRDDHAQQNKEQQTTTGSPTPSQSE